MYRSERATASCTNPLTQAANQRLNFHECMFRFFVDKFYYMYVLTEASQRICVLFLNCMSGLIRQIRIKRLSFLTMVLYLSSTVAGAKNTGVNVETTWLWNHLSSSSCNISSKQAAINASSIITASACKNTRAKQCNQTEKTTKHLNCLLQHTLCYYY